MQKISLICISQRTKNQLSERLSEFQLHGGKRGVCALCKIAAFAQPSMAKRGRRGSIGVDRGNGTLPCGSMDCEVTKWRGEMAYIIPILVMRVHNYSHYLSIFMIISPPCFSYFVSARATSYFSDQWQCIYLHASRTPLLVTAITDHLPHLMTSWFCEFCYPISSVYNSCSSRS